MRTAILCFVLALTACTLDVEPPDPTAPGFPPGENTFPDDEPAGMAQLMAAAMLQLVTSDNTFGDGPPPFTEYLIQSKFDPQAGSGEGSIASTRGLTDPQMAAIEAAISTFGPVTWIENADDGRDGLTPKTEGSVILGIGEPEFDGETALVPVSLWCGGLCGTWLTYTATLTDSGWVIDGIDGPIAIS